jgi:hypothetical protein
MKQSNKLLFASAMLLMLTLSSCMFKNGEYISDNPVEEFAEDVIEAETGASVDLTPSSVEADNSNPALKHIEVKILDKNF